MQRSLLAVLPQLAGGKCCWAVARRNSRRPTFPAPAREPAADAGRCAGPPAARDALTGSASLRPWAVSGWETCAAELDLHRARVTRAFQEVMFARHDAAAAEVPGVNGIVEAWVRGVPPPQFAAALAARGFTEAEPAANLLLEFRGAAGLRRLDAPGRARLDALLPRLLAAIADVTTPASGSQLDVLRRVLKVLEAIGSRSAYFALLNESAHVRRKLVELAGLGEFLAAQIASHPLLLDELLDESSGGLPSPRAELEREIHARLTHLVDDEPERQVEVLRQFQRAAIFRVAMADLTGKIPLMRVSDYLTEIAEIIIEQAMQLAWIQMTGQFGRPLCKDDNGGKNRRVVKICAVGYGKLGGFELGYASDLDLVFLHDSGSALAETDAAKPVDNQVFFIRFAQRVLHILTMHSAAGRLYEVDVRLRPSGKGGMLITRVGAFVEYQEKEAWTWEHQALLHARAVAGDLDLRAEFERVRVELLMRCVRRDSLRAEVRDMRLRMRRELSRARSGPDQFDIKQDAGGTADIEFLAQYWALLYAGTHPPVVMFADTIRQLESVASADLVPQATVDVLTDAYRRYRERSHHLSLENRETVVPRRNSGKPAPPSTAIWNANLPWRIRLYNPRHVSQSETAHHPTRRTNTRWIRATCICRARCPRCTCGTRTRGLSAHSSRPAGQVPVLRRRVHDFPGLTPQVNGTFLFSSSSPVRATGAALTGK
jgi:glutamate-ammonia-ligase adenylyltransferase